MAPTPRLISSTQPFRILLLGEDDRKSDSGLSAIACSLLRQLELAVQSLPGAPCFTVVDAAGDDGVIADLLTGAEDADAAVLLVGAPRGQLQWAMREAGRIHEQLHLTATLGFRRLVICVDKMGLEAELCAEHRFNEVQTELRGLLEAAGFQSSSTSFVPIADLCSHDAAAPFPWYSGKSLLEALHAAGDRNDNLVKPLRMPLHEVYMVRGAEVVAAGRIEMGILREGVQLALSPGDVAVRARRFEVDGKQVSEAHPGDWVRFVGLDSEEAVVSAGRCGALSFRTPPVADAARPLRFEVGNVMSEHTHGCASSCNSFRVEFVVLRDLPKGYIRNGYRSTLHVHTAHVPCIITELLWRRPGQGPRRVDHSPASLATGDVAEAWIRPLEPVCLETFSFCPPLGRLALSDKEVTVAAGVVKDVRRTAQQLAGFDD